jgi:hypothetical protein
VPLALVFDATITVGPMCRRASSRAADSLRDGLPVTPAVASAEPAPEFPDRA